jgi:8-oxo-dGTP pyrophosphatase MutT (NUDIX family)
MLHYRELLTEPESQLICDGKKCNASLLLMFHDKNQQLHVVFQKNQKLNPIQWTASGGKVDHQDNIPSPSYLNAMLTPSEQQQFEYKLSKQFNNQGLTAFARAAVRESYEEIGFPLYHALLDKATLHHFNRHDPKYNMVEVNQAFHTEFFYVYLGTCDVEEVNKQIMASGKPDAVSTTIAKVSDIEFVNDKTWTYQAADETSALSIRWTTAAMISFIKETLNPCDLLYCKPTFTAAYGTEKATRVQVSLASQETPKSRQTCFT